MAQQPPPQPGWYPDPAGGWGQRYWDGTAWGPVAPPAAPPPPAKRGVSPALLILLLPLLCCGSCGVLGLIGAFSHHDSGNSKSSTQAAAGSTANSTPTAKPLPGIGQEARDGKFGFTVISLSRSQIAGDPSNPYLQSKAKGEFINVRLQVVNIGSQPQTYFATNQKLIVGSQTFSADTTAAMGVGGADEEINPGLSVSTTVSFDVPPGTVPNYLEVHDSMFSGGAKIRLQA